MEATLICCGGVFAGMLTQAAIDGLGRDPNVSAGLKEVVNEVSRVHVIAAFALVLGFVIERSGLVGDYLTVTDEYRLAFDALRNVIITTAGGNLFLRAMMGIMGGHSEDDPDN